jgi:hypothetical protein
MPFKYPCTAHVFFPDRLSNHCQGVHCIFSKICTKPDAHSLSDPSRNRIRSNTRLQMKGRNNQHFHWAAWNVVHWLPRYASTTIYRCIALLQLLYRWQHQSRKLWMPPRMVLPKYQRPNLISTQETNIGSRYTYGFPYAIRLWLHNKIMQTTSRSHPKSWKWEYSLHWTRRSPTQKI